MEVLPILRVLWRRRLALVLGLLVVAGLVVVRGATDPSSGLASTRVALDTPNSQLVDVAPVGATTLAWRASLLAHLVSSDSAKQEVARRLGIPVDQLAVNDPIMSFPVVPASVPKAVAEVAAITPAPYVLSVFLPNGELPIIDIEAYAPDRSAAARLAGAATSFLESEGSPPGRPRMQPFVIQSVAPVHAKTVRSHNGVVKAGAVAIFLFCLWCACVALGPLVLRRVRPSARDMEWTPIR
jgi:hypothetical protein